jgi:CheY-like chemotaxis protein
VSTNQASSLVSAIAQLVGVLVWPTVLVFFLVRFRGALTSFLKNLGEFSFKVPGVEATAKRQQVEAAAALGAAVATRAPGDTSPKREADPQDIAAALPSPRSQRRLQGARILWVDDRPENNRFERQALEALGIDIDISTSTEDALEKVRRRSYDLIISDMGRPGDPQAGYTLLDDLRRSGNQTPFVIYAGSKSAEHVREARKHGAIGTTNMPQELITMVTNALTAR